MEPDANSSQRKVIPASEILAKIERGEAVEYDNVIIEGNLNLGSVLRMKIEKTKISPYIRHRFKEAMPENYYHYLPSVISPDFAPVVCSSIDIRDSKIRGYVVGRDTTFDQRVCFDGSQFYMGANFEGAKFKRSGTFNRTNFEGDAIFIKAEFNYFGEFVGAEFKRSLTFRNAKFDLGFNQEYACRIARKLLDKKGDSDEASHNFYLEMDAKRRQKPEYISYPEKLLMKWMFGYGVYPLRVMLSWLITSLVFAYIYYKSGMVSGAESPIDCLWFSIATAATPGYALYQPTGAIQLVSVLEAILGTFLWATFIALFARKWLR